MKAIIGIYMITLLSSCSVITIVTKSSGNLPPLLDKTGNSITNSISEKGKEVINGVSQGFFIRGENLENPLILYLHGGVPELPFILPRESEERLEKYFTVCYWDQRYAGMSYDKSINTSDLTVEQMVDDVYKMTKYLQKRFGKNKIYLLAHSWGTYLGVKTIEEYPNEYAAYIGISQITNQLESERLADDYLLQHAFAIGETKSVKELQKFDRNAEDFPNHEYLTSIRSELLEKYGVGTIRDNSSMSKLVNDVFGFEGYTISQKINFGRGSKFHTKHLFPYLFRDNLFQSSTSFNLPVYFLHGKYDQTVSYALVQKYVELIDAPHKEFIPFENSAHSPNMDESEKFIQVIRKIAKENHMNLNSKY
jgi:pimeloyl-ACP methyl ester carboxylesterase